jgi:hypothetical protein
MKIYFRDFSTEKRLGNNDLAYDSLSLSLSLYIYIYKYKLKYMYKFSENSVSSIFRI